MTRPFSSAGKGGERRGKREREEENLTAIIGQALSQLFTLLRERYDTNAIRAGMNMFMSACAYNIVPRGLHEPGRLAAV